MQSVSSRIWTRVAVSISYDDSHYTTGAACSLLWYYLAHSWEDKWVQTFTKRISQVVNITACLEFELDYFDIAFQQINHYTMGTPSSLVWYNQRNLHSEDIKNI